jgi:hypothetical protein
MMALYALCDVVPLEMVPMIVEKETTKEAWDAIVTMRVCNDRVKKATTHQLRQKFNLVMFNDGETVEDYALRLSDMAAHLAMLDEEVNDGEIIVKMLRSLLPHFKQITIAIKILLDVPTMSVADLTWRLKEVEEAFEEAPTLLKQDRKLYLTEEEWDSWRKKCKAENHFGSDARGGGAGKGHGRGRGHGVAALHQAGHRASPPTMSVGAVARWDIGRVSAARSPRRSRRTSRKMRRRPRSCSRRQP